MNDVIQVQILSVVVQVPNQIYTHDYIHKYNKKSRHWKCLAREGKGVKAQEGFGLTSQKCEGPTPLQELDPNVVNLKRRKWKTQNKPILEDEKQMDGNEAVDATQHR